MKKMNETQDVWIRLSLLIIFLSSVKKVFFIDDKISTGSSSWGRQLFSCACPWGRVSSRWYVDASESSFSFSPVLLKVSPLLSGKAKSLMYSIMLKRVIFSFSLRPGLGISCEKSKSLKGFLLGSSVARA